MATICHIQCEHIALASIFTDNFRIRITVCFRNFFFQYLKFVLLLMLLLFNLYNGCHLDWLRTAQSKFQRLSVHAVDSMQELADRTFLLDSIFGCHLFGFWIHREIFRDKHRSTSAHYHCHYWFVLSDLDIPPVDQTLPFVNSSSDSTAFHIRQDLPRAFCHTRSDFAGMCLVGYCTG